MKYRKEKDSMGEIDVPIDTLWGAQTQRSLNNFKIGNNIMPLDIIKSLTIVKQAASIVNNSSNNLSKEKMLLIIEACKEIIAEKHNSQFPLSVWQTGSGTQTNMNVNEVISNIANNLAKERYKDKDIFIHPNDDVNMSQSSNDVFPTAMNIAVYINLIKEYIPALIYLIESFQQNAIEFKEIVKVGRTHLMDATPITLGQEFSGYISQLENNLKYIKAGVQHVIELAIGGTAVGTGLNTPKDFAQNIVIEINKILGFNFKPTNNKFEAISTSDSLLGIASALKNGAVSLMKIANDLRLSASGPRCGIGELIMPINEPGSSIMPGKVNPTQCEALTMVCCQVIGNDVAITMGAMGGQFQLNTYRPMIAFNILNSIQLLSDAYYSFANNSIIGLKANETKIKQNLDNTLMLVTILNKHIGYDKASIIVKKAYEENISLKEATLSLQYLSEQDFDSIVKPESMI